MPVSCKDVVLPDVKHVHVLDCACVGGHGGAACGSYTHRIVMTCV